MNGSDPRSRRARARVIVRRRLAESWLARLVVQHPAPELVALWLIEVLACGLLAHLILSSGSGASGLYAANQAAVLALTVGVTSVAVGLYSPDTYLETRLLLINTAVGAALAFPALWLVGRAVGIDLVGLPSGGMRALKVLLASTALLFAVRLVFSYALRSDMFVRRVLIVGPDAAAARLSAAIRAMHRGFFEIVGVLPAAQAHAFASGRADGRRVWAVILAGDAADEVPARQLLRAHARGLRLYTDSEFWERQLRRIDVAGTPMAGSPADAAGFDPESGAYDEPGGATPVARIEAVLRRLFDIALSLTMLLFTLPLILVVMVAIRLDSAGPVLYRQERVGLRGQTFTLFKFRSMRTDAEARGPVWAAYRDTRITRVGSFIRLTRIDELPQLINVLTGQMSFIGPRPERPHFVAQLERLLPRYAVRTRVKPGLTGWAQVNYPYGASVEDARAKLSYDLYYVKHRSLLLDLRILLGTVRVVLFQRGAR